MPKKLQIKLLSPVGELLQVVTCFGGHVSVFRAHTPSDLRPYIRALAGAHSAERLVISVDGSEYTPEHHSLIGFGETPPHVGMSCREFLAHSGIAEGSIEGLLASFGLDAVGDTQCSDLSPDHERRLRIIAASHQYDKAIIINEPFEVISSQWRERIAEYLASAARSFNLLVAIPSLSYRPECWIDNDVITRLQVGQSVQRTIGFGSAGSENNVLMDQIRAMIRDEAKGSPSALTTPSDEPPHASAISASALAGAAIAMPPHENAGSLTTGIGKSLRQRAHASVPSTKGWQIGLLSFGVAVVGAGALLFSQESTTPPTEQKNGAVSPMPPTVEASSQGTQQPVHQQTVEGSPLNPPTAEAAGRALPALPPPPPEPPQQQFVLDAYPAVVKTALIEAARGLNVEGPQAPTEAARPEAVRPSNRSSGNLFKLLEKAGSNSNEAGAAAPSFQPLEGYSPPERDVISAQQPNSDDEDSRREAIRQKFLEAIRNAAERRQAAENDQ